MLPPSPLSILHNSHSPNSYQPAIQDNLFTFSTHLKHTPITTHNSEALNILTHITQPLPLTIIPFQFNVLRALYLPGSPEQASSITILITMESTVLGKPTGQFSIGSIQHQYLNEPQHYQSIFGPFTANIHPKHFNPATICYSCRPSSGTNLTFSAFDDAFEPYKYEPISNSLKPLFPAPDIRHLENNTDKAIRSRSHTQADNTTNQQIDPTAIRPTSFSPPPPIAEQVRLQCQSPKPRPRARLTLHPPKKRLFTLRPPKRPRLILHPPKRVKFDL